MQWWQVVMAGILVVGAVRVVVLVLRLRRGLAPTPEECEMRLTPQARAQVGSAIASGKLVLAVRHYRDATGADLQTAHEAVQRWAKGIRG
ncbi:MAG TPA: hypothetical protein VHM65_05960 [Candidatus Lustribacter sp.]|nr:hypothetical protein [Candidatus Lustribacter sp.]